MSNNRARAVGPTILVIFGATGDLTQRKLLPALYHLFREKLLPDSFALVGVSRTPHTDDKFREDMRAAVNEHSRKTFDGEVWDNFAPRLYYIAGDFTESTTYENLKSHLEKIAGELGSDSAAYNHLFYLATPPDVFRTVVTELGKADLDGRATRDNDRPGWTRIIFEKPFGRDLESARTLNAHILRTFNEEQVYRIDHYLGKETVQNIWTFRLGNSIFEPLWNRNYIDHVQILVAEKISIEGRGNYYDRAGALRDIVQNHILQLLALTAMEPPAQFTPDAVRNEKVKVLQAIEPITPGETEKYTVRGQYTTYHSEKGVAPDSKTETYVAMRLTIDNWRWAGVPFYLRTGKSLNRRVTEITIQFRQPPLMLFGHRPHEGHDGPHGLMEPNRLTIRVQPDEGITLCVGAKPPGSDFTLQPIALEFDYSDTFKTDPREAYERLLLDAIAGDATLFIRRDEVEASWELVDPLLEGWSAKIAPPPAPYWPGSWGPRESDELLRREGRDWYVSQE